MLRNSLLILMFAALLVSCAAKQEIKVVTRTVNKYETPPVEWLSIPPKPVKDYRTNGELYQYSLRLETMVEIMTVNLQKITVWAKEIKALEAKQNEAEFDTNP